MRRSAVTLALTLLSAGFSLAQTGFSTKTYPAVLPATSDNSHLLSADLNGDGRADLFSFGSRSSNSTVSGNVFLNNGSGGFLAPVALPGTGLLADAKIADLNNDGYPDIVGCMNVGTGQNQSSSVTVYLNNGTGGFSALPAASYIGQCNSLVVADFYKTGHPSVITAGYLPGQYGPGGTFYPGITSVLNFFQNDGTGTLTALGETQIDGEFDDPSTSSNYTSCGIIDVVSGDFRQTGNPDLVITTKCNSASPTLPGNFGTVGFAAFDTTSPSSYTNFTRLDSVQDLYTNGKAVDLNGDGKLDVVFDANQNPTSGALVYLKNIGSGTLILNTLLTSGNFYGFGTADLNGDGFTDIAVSYQNTSNPQAQSPTVSILAGSSAGTFTNSQSFATGPTTSVAGDLATADFNGDSKPDFATLIYDNTSKSTSLNVYLNTQGSSSQACSAPTTANTNVICSPGKGATLNSPVTVTAASNVTGLTLNRLYLDNQSVYQTTAQTFSTPITAAAGTHNLVLVSYSNSGKAFTTSTSFTVGNATGNGCIPSAAGVSICSPTPGTQSSSTISFTAGATAQSGNITAMRIYIDNKSVYTSTNSSPSKTYQFTQGLDIAAGTHNLVIVAYQSTGGSVQNSLSFTVPSSPCLPPTGGVGLKVCSPNGAGTTLNSPFTVVAGASTSVGYIAAFRIYIDNVAVSTISNPKTSSTFIINQSVPATSGTHSLVVVAYPSGGGAVNSEQTITVK